MSSVDLITIPIFWIGIAQFAGVEPLTRWARRISSRTGPKGRIILESLAAVVVAVGIFAVPLWLIDEFPLSPSSVRPWFFGALVGAIPGIAIARFRQWRSR